MIIAAYVMGIYLNKYVLSAYTKQSIFAIFFQALYCKYSMIYLNNMFNGMLFIALDVGGQ